MAALKQVLLNHMMTREEGGREKEKDKEQRKGRAVGGRLLRTTSLRGPEDSSSSNNPDCRTTPPSVVSAENGSGLYQAETGKEDRAPELPSGDTDIFETSEEYGELPGRDRWGGLQG